MPSGGRGGEGQWGAATWLKANWVLGLGCALLQFFLLF